VNRENDLSDDHVKSLISMSENDGNSFDLSEISGGYGCSILEIDFIIDISKKYRGIIGAQLSGAGLGGCAMLLVQRSYAQFIMEKIQQEFQNYFKKECSIQSVKAVNGCLIYLDSSFD